MHRPLASEHMLRLLGSLSNFYRFPFDATLVAQQYPPPHTVVSLRESKQPVISVRLQEHSEQIFSLWLSWFPRFGVGRHKKPRRDAAGLNRRTRAKPAAPVCRLW
jgi:hypothetical protein